MMTVHIESNIPVPDKMATWKGRLNSLRVNQSFSFPLTKRNSLRQTISGYFHVATSKRFTISCKNEPGGMARVWRLNDGPEQV